MKKLFRLSFECPFSLLYCNLLNIHWNLSLQSLDMIIDAMDAFGRAIFREAILREIMIVAYWSIWKHRNSIIFDNGSVALDRWKDNFREEPSVKGHLIIWVENFQ